MPDVADTTSFDVYLSYDGLQAADHRMDMRRLGYAMVGLDHVITAGIIFLLEMRAVSPRERLMFDVVTAEPQQGTVGILGAIVTAHSGTQGMLPFAVSIMKDKAPDFVWYWVCFVFKKLGGKEKQAEVILEKVMDHLAEIHKLNLEDRQREREHVQEIVRNLKPYASQVAVPMGESADKLRIKRRPDSKNFEEIGIPEAVAIRTNQPVEVGDEQIMSLRIDGLIKHTNRASVELSDDPGNFVNAEIRDILFDFTPNPYISAMNSDENINVRAVPTYKDGILWKIYIMAIMNE